MKLKRPNFSEEILTVFNTTNNGEIPFKFMNAVVVIQQLRKMLCLIITLTTAKYLNMNGLLHYNRHYSPNKVLLI